MRRYSLTLLLDRLKKEKEEDPDFPASRWWVDYMIRKGKLTLPKRPYSNRFALTPDIVEECVEAIKTKGEYHYGK